LGTAEIEKLQEINIQLQTSLNTSGLLQKIEKDRQFHLTIYNASQNKFLIQIIQDLRLKCYTVAYYAWADSNRVKAAIFEHREMIKALKERNKIKFQRWVKHQLVSSEKAYLEYLRRIQP
jgi:DNA-binding GntR family transcriptional regulator